MRERDVEQYLTRRVRGLGGQVRKVKWINHAGAPDRLVLLPPDYSAFVELKAPGKPLKPHQRREHERLRSFGLVTMKIDTLEEVDELWPKR